MHASHFKYILSCLISIRIHFYLQPLQIAQYIQMNLLLDEHLFTAIVNGEDLVGNAMRVNLLLAIGMDEKGFCLSM